MLHPYKTFTVIPSLPPKLSPLRDLAYNLSWTWNLETVDLFRRLDREGLVCLVGDHDTTIGELEGLDVRLIILIEEALTLVHRLETGVPASSWFKTEAAILSQDLAAFSEVTEERNYLLGLGWESEFTPR